MTTRAIAVLRRIMLDGKGAAPLRQRIEAASQLLDFEAPDEIVEEAKTFLTEVAEKEETSIDHKLDALKLLRRVSAAKVMPAKTVVRDDYDRIEHYRMMETLRRKGKLIEAGCWPLPKGWDDDLCSPDYVPIDDEEDPVETDLAEALRKSRLRARAMEDMSPAIDVTPPRIEHQGED
jgi:hypothetical protein